MNLFDYIKYQSIDFSNVEEMEILPSHLLKFLWLKLYPSLRNEDNEYMREWIARNVVDGSFAIPIKTTFAKALKEYYEIHHEPL